MQMMRERRVAALKARSEAHDQVGGHGAGAWRPRAAPRQPILERQTAVLAQQEREQIRRVQRESLRHTEAEEAARQMGGSLISAEALGLSTAEYQQLMRLQFQGAALRPFP